MYLYTHENKLLMKHFSVIVLLFFVTGSTFAQISSGKVEKKGKLFSKKEKKEKVKEPKEPFVPDEGLKDFTMFLGASYNVNAHKLKENTTAFGKPVGIRADEKVLSTWSGQFGVRNRIHKFLSFELGVSYDTYKVSYSGFLPNEGYNGNYTRAITTFALPINVYFTYGKRFQFFAGLGFSPYFPVKKVVETTVNKPSQSYFQRVRSLEGTNSVGIGTSFTLGVQYRFWRYGSVYLFPSYMYNFTNMYGKQEPHKEWYRGFNLRFGIAVHLPQKKHTGNSK